MMNTNTTTKSRGRGKRILVLGGALLLAAVVVGGVMYGPEFYGLLQFGKQLDQITHIRSRHCSFTGGYWNGGLVLSIQQRLQIFRWG